MGNIVQKPEKKIVIYSGHLVFAAAAILSMMGNVDQKVANIVVKMKGRQIPTILPKGAMLV